MAAIQHQLQLFGNTLDLRYIFNCLHLYKILWKSNAIGCIKGKEKQMERHKKMHQTRCRPAGVQTGAGGGPAWHRYS